MNDIENAARPTMTSMIEGRATDLNERDQLAISRWAFLKTVVGERMKPDHPKTPIEHVREFGRTQVLPANTFVLLGRYEGAKNAFYGHSTRDLAPSLDDAGHTYCAVLAIRHLVIEVIGFAFDHDWEVFAPEPEPQHLLIHRSSGDATWPPSTNLDDAALDELTARWLIGLRIERD